MRKSILLLAVVGFALGSAPRGASAASSSPFFSGAGVGPISSARELAVAAPLPNGKVLIAGGQTVGGGPATSSAELFDPVTDTFSSAGAGSMTTARSGAVAAPLPNGKVLIAGGENNSIALSSAELFDPSTDTFSSAGVGSMSTPRVDAVAAPLPNGMVLIAGGENNSSSGLSSAELFDPATGTFSSAGLGAMTVARAGAVAAPLPNGRVLIAGGENAGTGNSSSSAELFDPATGTFSGRGDRANDDSPRFRGSRTTAQRRCADCRRHERCRGSVERELFHPATGTFWARGSGR